MRKVETLSVDVDGTLLQYTCKRLTAKQEDEYRKWVQKKIMSESREMFGSFPMAMQIEALAKMGISLGAGPCSITGTEGGARIGTAEGIAKFIQLAASEDHPDMTEDGARELVIENLQECTRVVKSLHPMAKLIAAEEAKESPK